MSAGQRRSIVLHLDQITIINPGAIMSPRQNSLLSIFSTEANLVPTTDQIAEECPRWPFHFRPINEITLNALQIPDPYRWSSKACPHAYCMFCLQISFNSLGRGNPPSSMLSSRPPWLYDILGHCY